MSSVLEMRELPRPNHRRAICKMEHAFAFRNNSKEIEKCRAVLNQNVSPLTWSVELGQDTDAPQPGVLHDVRHVLRAVYVVTAVRPELAVHVNRWEISVICSVMFSR